MSLFLVIGKSFFSDFSHHGADGKEIQSKLEHLNHIMSQDWPSQHQQERRMFPSHCKSVLDFEDSLLGFFHKCLDVYVNIPRNFYINVL